MFSFSRYIKKNRRGLYIDIGAGSPKEYNYTNTLYSLGWKGFLVEPNPVLANILANERPKDIIYKGAILNYTGEVVLSTKNIYGIDMESWVYSAHKCLITGNGGSYHDFTVRCTTFTKLIKKHPQFINANFLNIDVDGNEIEILSGIDFNIFHPSVIIIEHRKREIDYHKIWGNIMEKKYNLAGQTSSTYYYTIKEGQGNEISQN